MGATHFQLKGFSECIFYNQQAIRIDPNFAGRPVSIGFDSVCFCKKDCVLIHGAEAFGNLGNALKELGDLDGAVQFYLKVSTISVPVLLIL